MEAPDPYAHLPQRPLPGQLLNYWDTQEGVQARASDPLLQPGYQLNKNMLGPSKAPSKLASGAPGVR